MEVTLVATSLALVWELSFPHQVLAATRPVNPRRQALVASVTSKPSVRLPAAPDRPVVVKKTVRVVVTAYSSTVAETDRDPFTTASGSKVRDGVVAMNGIAFGTKIRLPDYFGDKIFTVEDRMHPRHGTRYLDIWMPLKEQAKAWGVKRTTIEILE